MHVAPSQSTNNVRHLKPLRVLVAGHDRRFVRVTAFLLALNGYEVTESAPGGAVRAAEGHRADVVLLEAALSRGQTARRVAQLAALAREPAVLLVSDGKTHEWSGQAAVKKWTPLGDLIDAVERASLQRNAPISPATDAR